MQRSIVRMHPDVNARPKDVNAGKGSLLVRSMFPTLQGEMPFSGVPAFFIRLGGCNLGQKEAFCQGCDTDFRISESKALTFEEIYEAYWSSLSVFTLTRFRAETLGASRGARGTSSTLPLVVITGGEPSLHRELPKFLSAFDALHKERARNYTRPGLDVLDFPCFHPRVQIESNGYDLTVLHDCQKLGAYIVLSPKASVKGHTEAHAPVDGMGVYFVGTSGLVVDPNMLAYKYVVSSNPNDPHSTLPQWVQSEDRPAEALVYVSPATVYNRAYEGEVSSVWDSELVNQTATSANYAYAAKLAQLLDLRLSVQVHTLTAIA